MGDAFINCRCNTSSRAIRNSSLWLSPDGFNVTPLWQSWVVGAAYVDYAACTCSQVRAGSDHAAITGSCLYAIKCYKVSLPASSVSCLRIPLHTMLSALQGYNLVFVTPSNMSNANSSPDTLSLLQLDGNGQVPTCMVGGALRWRHSVRSVQTCSCHHVLCACRS